jgi:hypothetical protein
MERRSDGAAPDMLGVSRGRRKALKNASEADLAYKFNAFY